MTLSEAPEAPGGACPEGGRTLVLFPGALGDFVCFYPALDVLVKRSAAVNLLLGGRLAELLPGGPALQTGALDRPEVSRLFVEGGDAEPDIRSFLAPYDRIYSWSGAGEPRFGANLRAAACGRVRLFPFRPGGGGAVVRWSEYYLSCIGADSERLRLVSMPLVPAAVEWSESLWRRHGLSGSPVLAVAPGSGAAPKNWPLGRFMTVCRWWRRKTGGSSLVLLGPVEEELRLRVDLPDDTAVVLRGLSLDRLAAVLARCDAYTGNDSGPTHLAAALGVPTVAIFRVTDPREWMPWGPRVRVPGLRTPDDPGREHEGPGFAREVCVDEVIRELTHILASRLGNPRAW